MNDVRMISQTPMVNKLDILSSWCLADCSVVREGKDDLSCPKICERERESVKKRGCALSC